MKDETFLVWSREHKGWWKPNAMGYTTNIQEAGVYSYEQAKNIAEHANNHLLPDQPPQELILPMSTIRNPNNVPRN